MHDIRLYRLGSDPEWVFARVAEWTHTIIPATDIITPNRALGLTTFVGVDGHTATAEMRPPPAYNVRRHLYDIATGLVATHDYLARRSRWREGVRLFALPHINAEPLGGHIHATLWVRDPKMAALHRANYFYNRGDYDLYNPSVPRPSVSPELRALMEEHRIESINGQTGDMWTFARVMGFLLAPLEYWVQPWGARIRRNSRYGSPNNPDVVRYSYIEPPNVPKYRDWAFVHYEYRLPSTWLVHPWVAYAYLASAKLVLLNWGEVAKVTHGRALVDPRAQQTTPGNEHFRQLYTEQLSWLSRRPKVKITRDLRDLPRCVELLREGRDVWFDPFRGIDIDAWRALLL